MGATPHTTQETLAPGKPYGEAGRASACDVAVVGGKAVVVYGAIAGRPTVADRRGALPGDTVRVSERSRRITVRLARIVAPKTSQRPWGGQINGITEAANAGGI